VDSTHLLNLWDFFIFHVKSLAVSGFIRIFATECVSLYGLGKSKTLMDRGHQAVCRAGLEKVLTDVVVQSSQLRKLEKVRRSENLYEREVRFFHAFLFSLFY
jgi:hypothetical protein